MTKKQFAQLILMLCLLLIAYRAFQIDSDPLYPPAELGGTEFSDEGWYTEAAQTYTKIGAFTRSNNPSFHLRSPLFSYLLVPVYQMFGISLKASRTFSLAASILALLVFFVLCRQKFSIIFSVLACLLLLIQFENFNYSKLAIPEAAGTAFALLALGSWAILRNRYAATAYAFLAALLAGLTQNTLLFTFIAVLALSIVEVICSLFHSRKKEAVLLLGINLAAFCWAALIWSFNTPPHLPQENILYFELDALLILLSRPSISLLVILSGLYFIVAIVRNLLYSSANWTRTDTAIAMWTLLGLLYLGSYPSFLLSSYYFAPYGLIYLSLAFIQDACPSNIKPGALTFFCFLQILLQFPLYYQYNAQRPKSGYLTVSKKILSEIRKNSKSPHLNVMGPTTSFLSLIDPSVQPVESLPSPSGDQIDFLVIFEQEQGSFAQLLENKEPIGQYPIYDHRTETLLLYQLN